MPQSDLIIINQNFPSFRAALNDALEALSSKQSGTSDPPATIEFQDFADLTNNVLKRRNAADTGFIPHDTLLPNRFEIKVANYTHLLADMRRTIGLDSTTGNLTVTLLNAAISGNGFSTTFKRIDSSTNSVFIVVNGGGTIDGLTTIEIAFQDDFIEVMSDGSNYRIVKRNSYLRYHDKKQYFPVPVTIGGTYTNIMSEQGLNDISWPNITQLQNKVKIWIQFTGSSSSPNVDIRIQRFDVSFITVWEKLAIPTTSTGGAEYNDVIFDLHTGNDTNLDIVALPLRGVNALGSTWKFQAKAGGTPPKIHAFGFYWVK